MVVSDLKMKTRTQFTPISKLYCDAIALFSVTPTIFHNSPCLFKIDSSMYPGFREALNLSANLQQTIAGFNFLLYPSSSNEMLLIFRSENNIRILSTEVHCLFTVHRAVPVMQSANGKLE